MNSARKLAWLVVGGVMTATAQAQVPDLLNSFDPGGPVLGMGGSLRATGSDTLSAYFNPAGLAFIDKGVFGITERDLPRSLTAASGTYGSENLASIGRRGKAAVTHVGYASPTGKKSRFKGVFGVAYTLGGYINDVETASSLTSGNLTFSNYVLRRNARADYFTAGWATTNAAQTFAFGVGLNFLRQDVSVAESYSAKDDQGNTVNVQPTNNSSTGNGVGATIGIMGSSPNSNSLVWGLSYKTQINLSGNKDTAAVYDKVPARLLGGLAFRTDARNKRDYIVYAAQLEYNFKAQTTSFFDRSKNQANGGVGVEYNLVKGGGRIPIRFGYQSVQAGGVGFGSRNALTYGFGYRPANNRYGLDVSFVSPQSGSTDVSFSATLKFDK